MTRMTLLYVIGLVLIGIAVAIGQTPTLPVVGNSEMTLREGDLLTFRTSGQPERQVKVVKLSGASDPDGLVDVLDMGTGARYSIPAKIFMMMAKTASISQTPAPLAKSD